MSRVGTNTVHWITSFFGNCVTWSPKTTGMKQMPRLPQPAEVDR